MNARDPNLIPPSKRALVPWATVQPLIGQPFQVNENKFGPAFRQMLPGYRSWRVLYDDVEYYADEVELDLLYEGKTPESLGLEMVEDAAHA